MRTALLLKLSVCDPVRGQKDPDMPCTPILHLRPPGHHSQKEAANGFCVFNNVAIAAKHAKQKYGLQRYVRVGDTS